MEMGAALLSLVMFSFLFLTTADHGVKESTRTYCGRKLSNSLSLLCDGIYKRSDPLRSNALEDEYDTIMDGFQSIRDFFRGREDAMSMTGHRRFREKRQLIVNECCRKPCTITELMAYCGPKE